MIIVVAPYTGYNSAGKVDLGASKKIRFVISSLSKLSDEIILINSAHNADVKSSFQQRLISVDGVTVKEIILPTSTKRNIGKLLNLFDVGKTLDLVVRETQNSRPMLFWFYNAYAFEMLFAKKAFQKFGAPMVLEFEDWHFSRSRGINLKPFVDYFCWRNAAKLFSRVYAINAMVKSKVYPFCKDVYLLPGVVPNNLSNLYVKNPPFQSTSQINIGYFGGLKTEKGADIVLELARILPPKFMLHATGTGPLAGEFKTATDRPNSILKYHGMVDDDKLVDIISKCDVILNPHVPMNEFNEGLFPFKVIEAIASGRLLISTAVSFQGFEDVADAVMFVEHSTSEFASAIHASEQWYQKKSDRIRLSSLKAIELFGEDSIQKSLKAMVAANSSIQKNSLKMKS